MASELRVSALAIGLLLAGAEPEELITALIASSRHHPGIAAGDAIGANVTMLTLVLGIAALLQPFPVTRQRPNLRRSRVAATTLAAVAGLDGVIPRRKARFLSRRTRRSSSGCSGGNIASSPLPRRRILSSCCPTPVLIPPARALLAFVGLGLVAVGGKFAVDARSTSRGRSERTRAESA